MLELFMKDHVALKTGVMKIQVCHHRNKLHFHQMNAVFKKTLSVCIEDINPMFNKIFKEEHNTFPEHSILIDLYVLTWD